MPVVEIVSKTCLDCYKCLRKCPVQAIRVREGHARIMTERCLFCGQCVRECPRRAIRVRRGLERVMELLESGEPVIASVSIMESSRVAPINRQIMSDLLSMGFAGVETATRVARSVWTRYWNIARSRERATISSGCPAVVALVEQYHPEAIDLMAPVVSYAEAHARMIKERCRRRGFENVHVVNIAPEAAVLGEMRHSGLPTSLDGAITLNEMRRWLKRGGVKSPTVNAPELQIDEAGPPLEWVRSILPIYGIGECHDFLKKIPRGISHETIIEMTACRYGCALGSPWVLARVAEASGSMYPPDSALRPDAADEEIEVDLSRTFRDRYIEPAQPSPEELNAILKRIGIQEKEGRIDCAACGYDTCLELAKAVYDGVAEPEMCTPYMRRRTQQASSVIENTANAVLLVDHDLKIRFANPAFHRMFRCENESVIGRPTRDFLKNDLFERALAAGGRLSAIGKTEDLTFRKQIFPIRGQSLLGAVITDISAEARAGEEFRQVREATLDRAQEVISRQMHTAQEIAGLLGETTAETKALLVQLMDLARREPIT